MPCIWTHLFLYKSVRMPHGSMSKSKKYVDWHKHLVHLYVLATSANIINKNVTIVVCLLLGIINANSLVILFYYSTIHSASVLFESERPLCEFNTRLTFFHQLVHFHMPQLVCFKTWFWNNSTSFLIIFNIVVSEMPTLLTMKNQGCLVWKHKIILQYALNKCSSYQKKPPFECLYIL
jgi:hypothetical protein